jgi:hypothetical protein
MKVEIADSPLARLLLKDTIFRVMVTMLAGPIIEFRAQGPPTSTPALVIVDFHWRARLKVGSQLGGSDDEHMTNFSCTSGRS